MMSYDYGYVSHRMLYLTFRAKQLMTRRTAVMVIAASSVSFLILNTHVFVTYQINTSPHNHATSCMVSKAEYIHLAFNIIPWIDLVLYSMLPSLIIVVCNISIVIALVRIKWKNSSSIQGETTLQKSFNRIIPMLLLVSSVFVLCTLPLCIYLIGEQVLMKENKTQIIEVFSKILV